MDNVQLPSWVPIGFVIGVAVFILVILYLKTSIGITAKAKDGNVKEAGNSTLVGLIGLVPFVIGLIIIPVIGFMVLIAKDAIPGAAPVVVSTVTTMLAA